MKPRPIVLKFGSSLIRGTGDLPAVVQEIYRHYRRGRRVVVVVSAQYGVTESLLGTARSVSRRPLGPALALLLAGGERASAALLAMALDDAGLPCAVLDPLALELRAVGATLDAEPAALNVMRIEAELELGRVVVVPGFFGRCDSGAVKLLGRGGSDYSALFIAARLGAECLLLKDVDGVYDGDPASGAATRYSRMSWGDVAGLGARVVQAKAARFAAVGGVRYGVGAPGGAAPTRVGPGMATLAGPREGAPPLRVKLLGRGAVGRVVLERLLAQPGRFQVVAVMVRDAAKHADLPRGLVVTDTADVANGDCDVVIELLGGAEPAGGLIARSVSAGCDVVTANKLVMAREGVRLQRLARRAGARLLCSAAVGGVTPVLEAARALRGSVCRVEGVLNGTANFVLGRMAQGEALEGAVREAQSAGFAEADPTRDLDGSDVACKLAVIARAAFGRAARRVLISRRGLGGVAPGAPAAARLAGRAVRLVGSVWLDGGVARGTVTPVELPGSHPLAQAESEWNAVMLHRPAGQPVVLTGRGAGGVPTALAVMADLMDLWRARRGVRA